jgi:16S rRNA processing protein RimM
MISEKDIIKIGSTQKPYGIKGEIVILFSREEFAEADSEYYFLMIDGIPVPFFIEEFTFTTDRSASVKFEDIEDEKDASKYLNLDVYIPRSILTEENPEIEESWHLFVGYDIVDQSGNMIGTISDVDDSTLNVLFILSKDDKELLIPATEDFIIMIDDENKVIEMNLPEGLIDS